MRNSSDTPVSRRDALILGTGSVLFASGVGALERLIASERSQASAKYKRLIYLWQDGGGPSGPDSFDPKDSPHVSTVFPSIPTAVPGVHFANAYPRLAELADRITLFRERYNSDLSHPSAIASSLGRDKKSEKHTLHAIADQTASGIAVYAESPNVISAFNYRKDSFSVHKAAEAVWDTGKQRFSPPPLAQPDPRIDDRWRLRQSLNALSPVHASEEYSEYEEHTQHAVEMVQQAKDASFSLPSSDVDRYTNGEVPDPNSLGPLFARELIRRNIAGVVLLRMGYSDGKKSTSTGWDHHSNLEEKMRMMAPQTDHAIAQLIRDYEDGMLPDTVIVYDTEFGRTPKVNSSGGRDHHLWHPSFVVGEAFEPGAVIGATDTHGNGIDGTAGNNAVNNEQFLEYVLESVRPERNFALRAQAPKGVFQ